MQGKSRDGNWDGQPQCRQGGMTAAGWDDGFRMQKSWGAKKCDEENSDAEDTRRRPGL